MNVYPESELYREITFIAYYLHWPEAEIVRLPHGERRRYCAEISSLHRRIEPGPQNPFDIG